MSGRLAGAHVLVTGGAGTIGSTLVDQLVEAGVDHVTVLDNFVRGRHVNLDGARATGRVDVIEGDIRDRETLAREFPGIDLVFHLAAIRLTQCAEELDVDRSAIQAGLLDCAARWLGGYELHRHEECNLALAAQNESARLLLGLHLLERI